MTDTSGCGMRTAWKVTENILMYNKCSVPRIDHLVQCQCLLSLSTFQSISEMPLESYCSWSKMELKGTYLFMLLFIPVFLYWQTELKSGILSMTNAGYMTISFESFDGIAEAQLIHAYLDNDHTGNVWMNVLIHCP